jgi:hypothetical protein
MQLNTEATIIGLWQFPLFSVNVRNSESRYFNATYSLLLLTYFSVFAKPVSCNSSFYNAIQLCLKTKMSDNSTRSGHVLLLKFRTLYCILFNFVFKFILYSFYNTDILKRINILITLLYGNVLNIAPLVMLRNYERYYNEHTSCPEPFCFEA